MLTCPGSLLEGLAALKTRCEELKVQPRGTRGESGGRQASLMISLTSIGLVTVR